MLKKIPSFVYWMLLAVVVTAVPLACSSSSSSTTPTDAHSESAPTDSTSPG